MPSLTQAGLKQSLFAVNRTRNFQAANSVQQDSSIRRARPLRWTYDPWFGQDKANHLLVSFMLSSSAYLGLAANNNNRGQSLAGAIAGTIVIGAGKEIWDMYHPGTPSLRDLTADAVGALIGGLTARAIY